MVATEGLEKARAYLNQVPQDRQFYIPSEGCSFILQVKTPEEFTYFLFGGRAE